LEEAVWQSSNKNERRAFTTTALPNKIDLSLSLSLSLTNQIAQIINPIVLQPLCEPHYAEINEGIVISAIYNF